MIKLAITGIWICLVTIASMYAAASIWQTPANPEAEGDRYFGGLEALKTNLISVPVIADGSVKGYVLAQFTFTMKSNVLNRMTVKPDVYLLDSAFRSIYGGNARQLTGAKKQDLEALTAQIKDHVNARFGQAFVDEVLIEKYTFLPKDEVRGGANLVKMDSNLER